MTRRHSCTRRSRWFGGRQGTPTGRPESSRRAFTLVELLVVITIIGMLTAMVFPAVQSARESARKAVCSNKQSNIGKALLNYESTYGQLPGYVGRLGNNGTNYMDGTWVVMILPYMDRGDLWSLWSLGWDTNNPTLVNRARFWPEMTCPSHPPDNQELTDTPLGYVVNGGRDGRDSTTNPLAFGVFHNNGFDGRNANAAVPLNEARSSVEYIASHDGAAYTLMLSENINAGFWGNNSVRFYATSTAGISGTTRMRAEAAVAFNWNSTVSTAAISTSNPTPNRINGDKLWVNTSPAAWSGSTTRPRSPSSFHPGGVMATFCDGHTQFLRDSMDYVTYWNLMTPCGKAAGDALSGDPASILSNTTLGDF